MYFCNDDHCLTVTNSKSRYQDGKFGTVQLFDTAIEFYQLNTPTDEEKDGPDEIIDSVTYISFNDWIRCQVSFVAKASNYKVWLIFEIIYYYCVYLTKF
ncbi:unnamed protein product [Rotaria sordida]|uniref:Uncharacterized protein n=1 Tax=Rotaria sordida TaxID=392033 RepID=A0A819Q599_9BILA|nr:unnamed protein product [Rotaria sordida]